MCYPSFSKQERACMRMHAHGPAVCEHAAQFRIQAASCIIVWKFNAVLCTYHILNLTQLQTMITTMARVMRASTITPTTPPAIASTGKPCWLLLSVLGPPPPPPVIIPPGPPPPPPPSFVDVPCDGPCIWSGGGPWVGGGGGRDSTERTAVYKIIEECMVGKFLSSLVSRPLPHFKCCVQHWKRGSGLGMRLG